MSVPMTTERRVWSGFDEYPEVRIIAHRSEYGGAHIDISYTQLREGKPPAFIAGWKITTPTAALLAGTIREAVWRVTDHAERVVGGVVGEPIIFQVSFPISDDEVLVVEAISEANGYSVVIKARTRGKFSVLLELPWLRASEFARALIESVDVAEALSRDVMPKG